MDKKKGREEKGMGFRDPESSLGLGWFLGSLRLSGDSRLETSTDD